MLLIDDDVELLSVLASGLTKEGFKVVTASTSSEAQYKIGNQKFSLILIDLQISGRSGLRIMEQLRSPSSKNGFNMEVPVILMSGHLDVDSVRKAGKMAQAVLSKPLKVKEVAHQINKLLDPHVEGAIPPVTKPATQKEMGIPPEMKNLIHSVAGKLMVASMLTEELQELFEVRTDLTQEGKLLTRIAENLKKIDEILKSSVTLEKNPGLK